MIRHLALPPAPIALTSLLLVALGGCSAPQVRALPTPDDRTVYWIDTDLGFDVDDFMALLVAGKRLGPRIVGVSTTLYRPGHKARIARLILDEMGLCHVPVHTGLGTRSGEEARFRRRYPRWPPAFGPPYQRQGVATAAIFGAGRIERSQTGDDAVSALISAVNRHPGRLVLIVLGPMSNIAAALQRDPDIAKKLRAVVVMGGWYLRPDGAVKRPSYNTLMDLPAARRVLQRDDLPLLLVNSQSLADAGLRLTPAQYRALLETPEPTKLGAALLGEMKNWADEIGKRDGRLALADPVTAMVALDPSWVEDVAQARVRLHDLPGVHMDHPRAGALLDFAYGKGAVRVVRRFRRPDALRAQIVADLRHHLRQAPTVRCRRLASGSSCSDALFEDICRLDDGDLPATPPKHREPLHCDAGTRPGRLFAPMAEALPEDYRAVHRVCRKLDPSARTIDHRKPAVKAALRALLARLVERPALQRALADLPAERRVDALAEVWLASNAFEHVLCGEINPEGTVGGMHLWSEYYLAERAGRARYLCSRMGQDDDDVATFHFDWQPERLTTRHVKRVGGFQLGQSPACLLALGYLAIARNCQPSDGVKTAFGSVIYGKPVEWVFWTNERGLVTLFPLTHDSPGARN